MPTWVSVLISFGGFILGGGFLGFLQHMIDRHDQKKGKKSAEVEAIEKLETKIDTQKKDMDKRFEDIDRRFTALSQRMDMENATDARIRILGFSDEIMHGVRHSEESFNQVLQDITGYENTVTNTRIIRMRGQKRQSQIFRQLMRNVSKRATSWT